VKFAPAICFLLPLIVASTARAADLAWRAQNVDAGIWRASSENPSPADLEAANEFIEHFLSPAMKEELQRRAREKGQTPAELFLSLSPGERGTQGPSPALRELTCKSLSSAYARCSREHGACDSACSTAVCDSRRPTIDCDVAPSCRTGC